jgi:hypothetical protein
MFIMEENLNDYFDELGKVRVSQSEIPDLVVLLEEIAKNMLLKNKNYFIQDSDFSTAENIPEAKIQCDPDNEINCEKIIKLMVYLFKYTKKVVSDNLKKKANLQLKVY